MERYNNLILAREDVYIYNWVRRVRDILTRVPDVEIRCIDILPEGGDNEILLVPRGFDTVEFDRTYREYENDKFLALERVYKLLISGRNLGANQPFLLYPYAFWKKAGSGQRLKRYPSPVYRDRTILVVAERRLPSIMESIKKTEERTGRTFLSRVVATNQLDQLDSTHLDSRDVFIYLGADYRVPMDKLSERMRACEWVNLDLPPKYENGNDHDAARFARMSTSVLEALFDAPTYREAVEMLPEKLHPK